MKVKKGTFSWALEQIKKGRAVRRARWEGTIITICLCEGRDRLVRVHRGDATPYCASQYDLFGVDWERA